MRLSEKISLFGRELLISQRDIKDIIDAANFSRDNPAAEDAFFINSFIVSCGLKINVASLPLAEELPFYRIFKKRSRKKKIQEMEKIISVKNVMTLTMAEVFSIANKIAVLDYGGGNGETKKKVESMPI